MKKFLSLIAILTLAFAAFAQKKTGEQKEIDDLNRAIDHAVVKKDIEFLKKHYSDDFVFTHATGLIDSKESWIKGIENMKDARYASREHDSTVVELHNDVAIISGKLSVTREEKEKTSRYAVKYVRVYALRNKVWQMICHRSTGEAHF